MNSVKIIFFGSTSDSVIVLNALEQWSNATHKHFILSAVVTQPARPVGRKQIVTPTPVEIWAKEHNITALSFPSNKEKPWLYDNEQTVIDTLEPMKADLIVSACYGQKIPLKTLQAAPFGGLNVHPSLLPRWRGADPVPWAILMGDRQTGVTIVSLSEKFDAGDIAAQKKIPITETETSNTLRTKLFTIGAGLLTASLPDYLADKKKAQSVPSSPNTKIKKTYSDYARRFTRDDGFVPWELLKTATDGTVMDGSALLQYSNVTIVQATAEKKKGENNFPMAELIDRAFRALSPWPGLWTLIPINGLQKRLKILSLHPDPVSSNPAPRNPIPKKRLVLDTVQLEGKKPMDYHQFSEAYRPLQF